MPPSRIASGKRSKPVTAPITPEAMPSKAASPPRPIRRNPETRRAPSGVDRPDIRLISSTTSSHPRTRSLRFLCEGGGLHLMGSSPPFRSETASTSRDLRDGAGPVTAPRFRFRIGEPRKPMDFKGRCRSARPGAEQVPATNESRGCWEEQAAARRRPGFVCLGDRGSGSVSRGSASPQRKDAAPSSRRIRAGAPEGMLSRGRRMRGGRADFSFERARRASGWEDGAEEPPPARDGKAHGKHEQERERL